MPEVAPAAEFIFRPLTPQDEPALRQFLYHALFVPAGHALYPPDIIEQPELRRYVEAWGRPGDEGLLVEEGPRPVGAAWLRVWVGEDRGYGFVDAATPELSVAVLPRYRGRGLGRRLLAQLLSQARDRWAAVSLSVDAANPAQRLYERLGFVVTGRVDTSLIMVKRWE